MAYEFFFQYLYPLFQDSQFSFLRLFQYITFRSAYAALMALCLSLLAIPWLIQFFQYKKLSQPIRKDGPNRHFNKSGTPTMGGILVLSITTLSVLFWARLDFDYISIILLSLVLFGTLGFVDDYQKLAFKHSKGISSKIKILWQSLFSFSIVFAIIQLDSHAFLNSLNQQYILNSPIQTIHSKIVAHNLFPLYIPFVDTPIFNFSLYSVTFFLPYTSFVVHIPFLYLLFGAFVVIGSSNAVNLTDGLDGLVVGLLVFVGIAFAVLAYLSGHKNIAQYLNIAYVQQAGELTVFLSALVGSLLGFLWYNTHPAQIFMGDTGSLALGSSIGIVSLMIQKEFLLGIIGGIFVVETLSVILQILFFKWQKKRFFKMAPLHHHFELAGWHESKVVIRFWIIGATLALIGLSTLKIQ